MLLAVDIGNTSAVLALFRGQELVQQWRVNTDEIGVAVNVPWSEVSDIVICSVVPIATVRMQEWLLQQTTAPQAVVSSDLLVPLAVNIEQADEVGADRLVAAYAVWSHSAVTSVVVDFGTATTFDVVTAEGAYEGGVIAPGVRLSLAALEQAAAKLPHIEIEKPASIVGKSTTGAMQSGLFYGYLAMVDGIVNQLKKEYNVQQVVATGGLANYYAPHSEVIDRVDDDLIVNGLAILFDNQKR